jgi:hypothetical protein
MEIFKNKTSGKYFIGIDGEDGETALMITPNRRGKKTGASFICVFGDQRSRKPACR